MSKFFKVFAKTDFTQNANDSEILQFPLCLLNSILPSKHSEAP